MSYGESLSNWRQRLKDSQLAAIVRERWQRPDRGGAVYVIRIGTLSKIGLSVNPDLRIKSMQLPQAPDEVRIYKMATYAHARSLEAELHRQYAAVRQYGEWFALNDAQLAEIEATCRAWMAH